MLISGLKKKKAAFDWMHSLDQAANKNERAVWLSFWRQALTWTLTIIETGDDRGISGTPSEWDRWLFEKITIQVLCMEDTEEPADLWRPILLRKLVDLQYPQAMELQQNLLLNNQKSVFG